MIRILVAFAVCLGVAALSPAHAADAKPPADGSVLPFPPVPTASVAGPTLQTSRHVRRAEPDHLRAGAPNILIVLLDDVGFGLPSTFGGEVQTPTLTRLANEGISYNSFHTTSICSPTRAALLTGRNHQHVGSGTIAERALDFDGYTGVIPKSSATIAEVLRQYGYRTAAFGKWHDTPPWEISPVGPFNHWPTGLGFEYFYGFMGGETDQWAPLLVQDNHMIDPPRREGYHLTEDLTDQAIRYIADHTANAPDTPWLTWLAYGACHAPHQGPQDLIRHYDTVFAEGWDVERERRRLLELARRDKKARGQEAVENLLEVATEYVWDHICGEPEEPSQEQLFDAMVPLLNEWFSKTTPEERAKTT